MSDKVTVSEKDKPFILAISSILLFASEIALEVYTAIIKVQVPKLDEAMAATIGFMSTAWTYYLVKKNGSQPQTKTQ